MQIKDEKQLKELKSSVEVMSENFKEYKKNRKENGKNHKLITEWGQPLEEKDWFNWKNIMAIVSSVPAETVY